MIILSVNRLFTVTLCMSDRQRKQHCARVRAILGGGISFVVGVAERLAVRYGL